MSKRRQWLSLGIGIAWVFCAYVLIKLLLRYVPNDFPSQLRMPLIIGCNWLIGLGPLVLSIRDKHRFFETKRLDLQLLWGLAAALVPSLLLTVLPHLVGLGHMVGGSAHYTPMALLREGITYLIAVALVEEFVFRGFVYRRLKQLIPSEWAVMWISSGLFGLFHFMNGDFLQPLVTGALGFFWCLCRKKLPHCTLLSLIVGHAVYDWLICLWAYIFAA